MSRKRNPLADFNELSRIEPDPLSTQRAIHRVQSHMRQRMARIARYTGLAVAILLLAGGAVIVLLWDRGASPAFAQVVENVKKSQSLTFTRHSGLLVHKYYIQQHLMRSEWWTEKDLASGVPPEEITVVDLQSKDLVNVNYRNRFHNRAKIIDHDAGFYSNLIEYFKTLSDSDARFAGEVTLSDGSKTYEFDLDHFVSYPWHYPKG